MAQFIKMIDDPDSCKRNTGGINYRRREYRARGLQVKKNINTECSLCHLELSRGIEHTVIAGLIYCETCTGSAPKCSECTGRYIPKVKNQKTCSDSCSLSREKRRNQERMKAYRDRLTQIECKLTEVQTELNNLTSFDFSEEK